MAEKVIVLGINKQEKYESLLPQLKALVELETDLIANMANVCAALKMTFNFLWVGFYFVKSNQLVLGPFQGPVACTRIDFGKGVCGKAWKEKSVIIVEDVDAFPGHIACSSLSKSEIVLPIYDSTKELIAVLDIDSELYYFEKIDELYLSKLINLLKI